MANAFFIALRICLIAAALSTFGCEEKPPLLQAVPETTFDTSYVQITPPFTGFTNPQDILIGKDQLLYVADTYHEGHGRIVVMNRAGGILSQRRMLHPISLAQTSNLDLIVGGMIVAANGDTAGALFRLQLVNANHHLDSARVDTIWRELARPARRFPGITVFGDNAFLVARTGPDNTSFIDPDARVLQFDRRNTFISPVPSLATRSGSGITDISAPTGIASFPGVRDFVLCQSTLNVFNRGALWMKYESSAEFEGWLAKFDPGVDFLRLRFEQPEAVAIDDVRRDVFVADAALDSVLKFNSRGAFKAESFGIARTDGAMRRPTGLAYFERVLYVLEAERGQVLRFRLTTDVPR